MREQVEVIYENGVFRPLGVLPGQFEEHQHLTVTIENQSSSADWLAAADATVSLEAVRHVLGKTTGTLTQLIHAEREER